MGLELDSRMDGFELGDKIANHPGSSHKQRGAYLYKKKMLNCNKNPNELRNKASTPELDFRRSQEDSPETTPSALERACRNKEAKIVSPLRAVGAYVYHVWTYPQTEIDRQQAQDSGLLPRHFT
ncbi:hypothetical protein RF11_05685 [Thelohanellus kitauei]|uniref:Uncharacterized protein n=1 Tax=Thelohanellus kitauei TaxID=669202 RepID=A0A0C2NH46_THEKT|nr:hypothetical protein RF11_05685 [Thelohanellus kitauei]